MTFRVYIALISMIMGLRQLYPGTRPAFIQVFFVIIVLSMIAATILMCAAHRTLMRRLRNLKKDIDRITQGNIPRQRIVVRGRDEISQLGTGINRFVEEIENIQAKYLESEERFRKIFEEGPLGMAFINRNYQFIRVNPKLCQMLGYEEEEMKRMKVFDIMHPEESFEDLGFVQMLFRGETAYFKFEKRYIKKNEETVWINLSASVIHDERGKTLYGMIMVEDITERKVVEEALRKSEQRYELV